MRSTYQPLLYTKEGDCGSPGRDDCEIRYSVISKACGGFIDKSVIEFCASESYFGFRALQDGATEVIALELDEWKTNTVNDIATRNNFPLRSFRFIPELENNIGNKKFDVGIYLDTHYHEGTEEFLRLIAKRTPILFSSPSKDNEHFEHDLLKLYRYIMPIYTGYAERTIYQCKA
jgi:hypothetical protein